MSSQSTEYATGREVEDTTDTHIIKAAWEQLSDAQLLGLMCPQEYVGIRKSTKPDGDNTKETQIIKAVWDQIGDGHILNLGTQEYAGIRKSTKPDGDNTSDQTNAATQ